MAACARVRISGIKAECIVNISGPFIQRPVATTLLTIALAVAGMVAYAQLPVAPLPSVDFPTIMVQAQMSGASPDTMAETVAAPLERSLGQIADVSEMTSENSTGLTRIIIQFDLKRNIEGAARDVEAAINAARADLPSTLKSTPTYRRVNPADMPILTLALTSETLSLGQLYDKASMLQQRLFQIQGMGNVEIGGSTLPAVRVEMNPGALFKYGIGLEDVRAALSAANANSAKGAIQDGPRRYQLYSNDQALHASDYRDLVIAWRNERPVFLRDVAEVVDSVESLRSLGLSNGKPSVALMLFKQPGGNIVDIVDRVKALLPKFRAALPHNVTMTLSGDRSSTIRASLGHTERTLVISVLLVVLVVLLFLRSLRATFIPAVTVPVSILGTFGVMRLCGYSLDNLSLMALTIATGFVVDDTIVVLENIARYREAGVPRLEAALRGAREVSFTVVSMSISLVAVFLPILLLGGIVGRLFAEFAIVLSVAIGISLVLALTTTPMMCAQVFGDGKHRHPPGRMSRGVGEVLDGLHRLYERSLRKALAHPFLVLTTMLLIVVLNVLLFVIVPKGLFPQQDSGLLMGGITADQSISFQAMEKKLEQAQAIVQADPAVETVTGVTGGRDSTNQARVFVTLKPLAQRDVSALQVVERLRSRLASIPGAQVRMFPMQDLFIGGRKSFAQYQYTLQADNNALLQQWTEKLTTVLKQLPDLADVTSDLQTGGLETKVMIDRTTAARYDLTPDIIDATLYDAFGERQVSTIYQAQNQYHVIMELAPRYLEDPESLKLIYVSSSGKSATGTSSTNAVSGTVTGSSTSTSTTASSSSSARNQATNSIATSSGGRASSGTAVSTSGGTMIPLSAFARLVPSTAPVQVNHQGRASAATISFNLAPGIKLANATASIQNAVSDMHMPTSIHASFSGSAGTAQAVIAGMPMLIASALLAVYVVLGILYESYVHPVTILSTLPSAGLGAVLALLLANTEFTVIALIGVFLLIGIVKKNAIMMVDFALKAERNGDLSPKEAIFQACLMRFRPILMTTCTALFGAVPLVLDHGMGAELRRPLGIAIIGGLIVSQMLTLYTTPVIYLYLDRFRRHSLALWRRSLPGTGIVAATADHHRKEDLQ